MFVAVWISCFLFVLFILVVLALADFVRDAASDRMVDEHCPPIPECALGNSSDPVFRGATEITVPDATTTKPDISQRLLERARASRYQDCNKFREQQLENPRFI